MNSGRHPSWGTGLRRQRAALALVGVLAVLWPNARAMAQGYAPELAASKMTLPEGLSVRLCASEPEIRQPILVKCDDRGRLWVIQYLQYPNPAGLTRLKVDRWSRTVYDRVPEPPPRGPKGADRITIVEDTDGDGQADRFHDFVDGLNLATGLAFGHGGVYVLQVPYLLFYPDRDRDDVPDSDPQVLLSGFGMEDAQSLANHLTWGPDGWLYGVNGSTTTCHIRGLEFQQGCWRYHPLTDRFELFCEGGGNTYGLTFDERGNLFYSTNGGPFVNAVQGGYFYKSFGKHGPLHNRFAYGYFEQLERDNVPGGPPTGGTIYLGDSFPEYLRGTFISGNFLGHTCSWWNIFPQGTTVRATYGGVLLDGHDTWFGPTDMCLAPDGSMYVCDFHDQRTAHPDPDANWDRSNGRVYQIVTSESLEKDSRVRDQDLAALSSGELVRLLTHKNGWYADQARCLLAERRDRSVMKPLLEMARQQDNEPKALQGLWGLYVTAGLEDALATEMLDHSKPYVRAWTVRLLGDEGRVSPEIARLLVQLAGEDPSAMVRSQLVATAKRLDGSVALPIIRRLLERGEDLADPRIPLLLWWAIESKAMSDADELLRMFARSEAWETPGVREHVFRLVRRYAAEGSAAGCAACLYLLKSVPAQQRTPAHEALAQGLAERATGLGKVEQGGLFEQFAPIGTAGETATAHFEPLTPELAKYVSAEWQRAKSDAFWQRLAMRAGITDAYSYVLSAVRDSDTPTDALVRSLGVLAEFGESDCVGTVLPLVDASRPPDVVGAALDVLRRFRGMEIDSAVLQAYPQFSAELRGRARELLFSRPDSARVFLEAIDGGRFDAQEVPIEQLRLIALHEDDTLNALVRKNWGNIQRGTPEEKLATMRRFSNDLRAAAGNREQGKPLYQKHCGSCHKLFDEGNQVGPDLTKANRQDQGALLANVVDPSAVIRKEYASFVVATTSGQIVTGLIAEQDAASITLLDAKNQRIRVPLAEVDMLEETNVSLMPEKILDELTPQELRDLFSYLQAEGS